MALLYLSDALEIWHLYIALVANGVASAFILPALDASTPMLMPQDQLGRAAGVTQMLQSFEIILAPVLAVPLFLGLGLGAVFVVDFVTFGVSIFVLALSVISQPARVLQEAGASVWEEFRFGVTYLKERPPFLMLMFLVSTSVLILPGIGYALATPLSLAISDEAGAAAVLTCFGVGSLVAGVLLAVWGGPMRRMNGILGSMILAGLTLATLAILSFVVRPIWRLEDALPDQPPQVDSESDSEQEADESARMAEEGGGDDATGC